MMDELAASMKAREFITRVGVSSIPAPVERYAAEIGGSIKKAELNKDEDAWSARLPNGKYKICVNCSHNNRRQRFSVCHEIAHAVLEIPADHTHPSWQYSRKPQGEVLCDIFAAELLLPYKVFKPRADVVDPGMKSISALASEFDASLIATGSRYAAFAREPCAFVVSEGGKVRFSSRSAALRDARAWIKLGSPVPPGSYSARVRASEDPTGSEEAAPDQWFDDWERDGTLYEDAFHIDQWDQTLTLLWFADDELPPQRSERRQWEQQVQGLKELDGILPWPGRKKRR